MSLAAPAQPEISPNLKTIQSVLLLLYFGLVFTGLILPTRQIEYEAAEVANQRAINYEAFYQAETAPGGRRYAWTRPEARLYFNDVPRYAPLRFELELNFDRPANTPPGQLQFTEIRSREAAQPITTLVADPQRPGFQTYVLNIPPCQTCETGLILELKANGFQPPGDTRTLGVVTDHFDLQLGWGHFRYLLWPQPYLIGVLLTALALVSWLRKTAMTGLAGLLWLTPAALCLAIFCPVLYDDSWWIVAMALIVLITSFWDAILLRLPPLTRASAPPSSLKWFSLASLIALLVAGATLIIMFAIVPLYATDLKDVELYQNWLQDLNRNNGLFDLYNHSTSLNYLPLLLYLLWFYNLVTAPFGLNGDALTLKLFFSLPILINLYILWRIGIKSYDNIDPHNSAPPDQVPLIVNRQSTIAQDHIVVNRQSFIAALLLVGLSPLLIFNASLWGQTDTLLACMLVWTLLAIQTRRPYLAGVLLGLDWTMKPQSWVLAPLLLLFLLRYDGWRKTFIAGSIGVALLVGLSAPAFGFDLQSFRQFLFQPNFAGEFNAGSANAYNLLYLFGYGTKEAPTVVALGGFAIIAVVYLALGWWVWQNKAGPDKARASENLAAGLVLIVFFLCAIKMRERYIEYGLFFVGMAAFYAGWQTKRRGLLLAFLAIDLFAILNQLAVFVVHRNSRDYNTVFLWHDLILAGWLPAVIALGFSAAFIYLFQLYRLFHRQRG